MPCRRSIYRTGIESGSCNRISNKHINKLNRRPFFPMAKPNANLTGVYNSSETITFDINSRIVLFSDCHRGDRSRSDDFYPNRSIYMNALYQYFIRGFSYIEIGDGDELWENDRFSSLFYAHKEVYLLLQKFHREGRLHMIWGNHDAFKKSERYVRNNLYEYFDFHTKKYKPLFTNLKVHEGLILEYSNSPVKIFAVHGHQGDLLNDQLWPISRLLVRYIWRNFQIIRGRYPFSPAENIRKSVIVEHDLINWAKENQQILIAGHTHNPIFSMPGNPPYFNTGSCTTDSYITCIEIINGEISLVKWNRKTDNYGTPKILKQIIGGPVKIIDYDFFNQRASANPSDAQV